MTGIVRLIIKINVCKFQFYTEVYNELVYGHAAEVFALIEYLVCTVLLLCNSMKGILILFIFFISYLYIKIRYEPNSITWCRKMPVSTTTSTSTITAYNILDHCCGWQGGSMGNRRFLSALLSRPTELNLFLWIFCNQLIFWVHVPSLNGAFSIEKCMIRHVMIIIRDFLNKINTKVLYGSSISNTIGSHDYFPLANHNENTKLLYSLWPITWLHEW